MVIFEYKSTVYAFFTFFSQSSSHLFAIESLSVDSVDGTMISFVGKEIMLRVIVSWNP